MAKGPKQNRWRSVVILGAFLYIWVMVAVIAGALALALSPLARQVATGETGPLHPVLIAVLLLVLAASFLLSRWLLRRTLRGRTVAGIALIPVALTLLALAAGWSVLAPAGPDGLIHGDHDETDVADRSQAVGR